MATASGGLVAGEVHIFGPTGQEIVPATLCKVARLGHRAEANSVSESSGELLAPRQGSPDSKVRISRGREGKGLGMA